MQTNVLSNNQKKYWNQLTRKIKKREYSLTKNPCPCGYSDDILLGSVDRYDLPLTTVICEKCGLIRSDPYFTQKSLESFYKYEYRGLYGSKLHPDLTIFNDLRNGGVFLYNYLKTYYFEHDFSKKTVFEIGCSTGGVLDYFKFRGNLVYGCDYDPLYLNFGKKRGLKLLEGGSEVLLSLGKKADIVILSHVLEHFRDLPKELKKIKTLLKDDGVLLLAVPGVRYIDHSYDGVFKSLVQIAHCYCFTLKTLSGVLARSGFKLAYGDESAFGVFIKAKKVRQLKDSYIEIMKYIDDSYRLRWYYTVKRHLYDSTISFFKHIYLYNFMLSTVYSTKKLIRGISSRYKK